ncbi:hypothetical protein Cantr_10740 [Candida viswanathii]|uniref:Uncharacterized protein n=1 Tax=Candida viswanathii TaxID=5486 RepID=A0A367YGZ8_9ASCO|nr:hypothetical protein Cantr_10740 [Candida viswanathii]
MSNSKAESALAHARSSGDKENNHIEDDHAKIATTSHDDDDHHDTTLYDSIVDIPPPPPPHAGPKVVPADEDWSIISSSSDIDDERSTTSSFEYQRGGTLSDCNTNKDSLKVPRQFIIGSSGKGAAGGFDEQETLEDVENLEHSQNTISTPSGSASSSGSIISSREGDDEEGDEEDLIDVDSKIKFFENLNDSIKQKSNQFYHDFAKVHLDNYINEQQQQQQQGCASNSATTCSASSSVGYDMDDTIELLADGSKVIIGSPNDVKSPLLPEKPKAKKPKTKKNKKLLIRAVEKLQVFLEAHSDYLYYYIFVAMIVGIIPAYFTVNYLLFPRPVKPVSSIDKLGEVWNSLLYEDVSSASIFGKKQKINKLFKLGNLVKGKIDQEVIPQLSLFVDNINMFTTNTLVPQCVLFWARTQEFGKSSLDNLGKWWTEYSTVGLNKFDEFSKIGYAKAVEYQAVGLTKMGIFYNTTSLYSKIWSKNIIAGSNDVYHNLKVIFRQESAHAKVLSRSFIENMKVFNEYQKEKVSKGWGELVSLWHSEAPKFKATLDHNSVEIYKNGKKLFQSVVEKLTT